MSRSSISTLLPSLRLTPNLPSRSWYFIAGVTLSTLNKPDEVKEVFQYALKEDGDSAETRMSIARRMREALVKAAVIGGLPKSINAILALKKVTPGHLLDEPLGHSPTKRSIEVYDVPSSRIMQRGHAFFDQIYGKISKRVMGQMDRSGTEDLGILARLMYGYVLSNTNILSPAESSFVLLAGLIPQDVRSCNMKARMPSLKGHLKGALNNGATQEEVQAVRDLVVRICEASGMARLSEGAPSVWGWQGEVANL
ncbi:MAG: hypothetical protein Q9220_001455 [cf. Caloplaca sp. 1 TL-2023]